MKKILVWLRRDLRLHDHHALAQACQDADKVFLCFNFDPHILKKLPSKKDKRLTFIIESLTEMEERLQKIGSSLHISYGVPEKEIPKLAKKLDVEAVYTNRDYEPYAKERDQKVKSELLQRGIDFCNFKDHVFFEKDEVLKSDGSLYKVFTPYKNQWLTLFEKQERLVPDYKVQSKKIAQWKNKHSLLESDCHEKLGFIVLPALLTGGSSHGLKLLKRFEAKLKDYKKSRDYPIIDGTSLLSVYIRHGNISIRDMFRLAITQNNEGAKTWLSELIWREFYQMILAAHPEVVGQSFKPQYDQIKWPGSDAHFKAWCEGKTGFPIVDAAMRCFNETGLMHNRLRMVVANFLCKILLVDWRRGEEYFAAKLLDFDLAANNGGWQWSSGSGCDAQPYFRIFNPYIQTEKFDPEEKFIQKWCPKKLDPIVSYEVQRKKCLKVYEVVKSI